MNRREFMGGFALAGAALAQSQPVPQSGATQEGWFDRPMRWAQLTLVEDDPGNAKYDVQFWLDYFKRTHSDAACLSAGGCVAYYPTKIPLHYKSKFLGNRDAFGELVAGCRKLGMNVIARTDPHAVHQDVFDAHPDWVQTEANGQKRRHWAMPSLWVTCALGPYNLEFMTEVTKEIVTLYKVDGVFSNRWSGHGMCYCEHCTVNFKKATGMDLPRTTDPKDPARRAYITWREQRLFQVWKTWDDAIRKINPAARFIPNSGGGASADLDMKYIGEHAEILFADRQARSGLAAPWANGKNGKEYRSTMGRKPIGGIFSVGVEESYRWKDSVQNGAEIRLWALDGVANGLRPWFTKFAGTVNDKRWLPVVEDLYGWLHRNERYMRNEAPLARVGLVYSQQTHRYYGGTEARRKVDDHANGYYHALVEARIPFEMAHDQLLDAERLAPLQCLILPNIAALSTRQCEQLRAFVQRGGGLVATHETSLYDETGARRADFGLADLFGASFAGTVEPRMQNSYLRLESPRHPILAGLEDTERIINGVSRVHTKTTAAYPNPPITLIPSYPDLPMEEVYPRVPKTDIPEVFVRQFGKGRVVYFPFDLDRTFWEVLSPDHGKLLRNAVEWATNEPRPVTVTGPGMLDVTVWRQKGSLTVHLVNLTNPMMMKGPIREFIPSPPQKVEVRVPSRSKKVQLLVSGRTPQVAEANGVVTLTIPSIVDHEVVAIDL